MSASVTVLPSGLSVVTDAMPGFATAAIGVSFGAGARSEAENEHGLAHLLEHMAFKGTARRSALAIAEDIEQVGGDLNAATGVEQTSYSARVLSADIPLALDMLADIVTGSVFDPVELKREKNVIIQEIGAVEDTPDDLVFDLLQDTAFPHQALGRSILGTTKTVRALDRASLGGFLERGYRASNAVVVAAGSVEHEAVVAEAERLFSRLGPGDAAELMPASYRGGDIRREKRDLEQLHVAIAFEGRPYDAPDAYAAQVFANLVGGGMSSRLFQEVRETRGLAYAVHAFHWGYADAGLFGAYAALGPEDAADILPVMLDVLHAAADEATDREVARAKAQMRAGLLMALEQPAARADHHARHQLAHGRPLDAAEQIAKIDAVTTGDARAAGRRMLASPPTLAAIGPTRRLMNEARLSERLGARLSAA